jgi:hypothetical protein
MSETYDIFSASKQSMFVKIYHTKKAKKAIPKG